MNTFLNFKKEKKKKNDPEILSGDVIRKCDFRIIRAIPYIDQVYRKYDKRTI